MTAVATAATKTTKQPNLGPKPGGGLYKTKNSEQRPKHKGSKYAKKNKGKKPQRTVKRGEPAFLYYVEGTDIQATKTPCEKDYEATPQRPAQSHLGTWKNPLTGKKCKVTRKRNKPEDTDESQSQTETSA